MTENQEPQKPEWFQIADGDAPSAQVRKVNKKLPTLAVLVTGAVIATGAFFANASEEESASASEQATSFNQAQGANSSTPVAPADQIAPGSVGGGNQPNAPQPKAPGGVTAPNSGLQNPSVGTLPQRGEGDDDDDFGDHHERGDRPEHDGDHEGRERHERGSGTVNPTLPSTSGTSTTKN